MSWKLKSGRCLMFSPALVRYLCPQEDGGLWDSGEEDGVWLARGRYRLYLSASERREVADAVIACWNRWAETGKP